MSSPGLARAPAAVRSGIAAALACACLASRAADESDDRQSALKKRPGADRPLLAPEEWKRLDHAVDRGVEFIAKSQEFDGSFPTSANGQPGVTSLCVMALLSRGHQPGKGPFGAPIERAIDFVLTQQDPKTGAIMAPYRAVGSRTDDLIYSHAISGVMLAEVYGMTSARRHERIRTAVLKALDFTRKDQLRPRNQAEQGGWRYVPQRSYGDSDLSVTAWQLMFYRSARNAEFDVPEAWVKAAMGYVHRSFDARQRGFVYSLYGRGRFCTRGMVGAGIVSLALGGEHQSETAKIAGGWILEHPFEPYNGSYGQEDRYHYGAFYCSQAMFQLGGEYWHRFFPRLLQVLADAQRADGSWDIEALDADGNFGNSYTTALSVLALTTPYQILPIYQR
jgi:hypothetical protein